MDREECQLADWRSIGYEDGAKGRPLSYLGNHRKACAEHGVTPDMERYEEGRLAGLEEYCTPRKGFDLGKSGHKHNPVCSAPLAEAFREAWSNGAEVHAAKMQLQNSKQKLDRQRNLIETLQQQIEETEADLVKDGISSKRRKILLDELKVLGIDLEEAETELFEYQDRVDEDRDYLEQLENRYRY
ncbi:MAG: DUF2799 domain-containing protein [Candidatus Thiodiazotropha sp. (ex Ctena orbiculata)]|uniref:DUF2799 domain-containing protein n=1 Tax=Candidatus Thiodiazotropha taylori TaxID=2792791 RepID=A0A944QUE9_9GAMM|nr:DUF2799 domain-containing protein [Candidatus Thiodiazotropha taylori]MBT2988864.1 DUF2799 domain-containing protein [Candidatus Thiodiazotropha taylori]MBT2998975.1 DUF2799 domain-containing protein [Candidatus Thiodiazotropha taylori]MBT3002940.1 DUF2799 domain-containing protein [Candidatus Thiodiazotropha taylori]MBT3028326.1 DUF2799 domain-containing protein [Candidatus Thiodiazotropha taylori]